MLFIPSQEFRFALIRASGFIRPDASVPTVVSLTRSNGSCWTKNSFIAQKLEYILF